MQEQSPEGSKAALASYNIQELPFMVLWKNEAASKTGYVTGLEPATGFPYPKPIEREAGRVPKLGAGEHYHIKVTITALITWEEIQNAVSRINALQRAEPEVAKMPFGSGVRV